MKKRIIPLLLSVFMLLSLAACGGDVPAETSTPSPTPTPEAAPSLSPSTEPIAEENEAPAIISFSYESELLDSEGIIMLTAQSVVPDVSIPGNDEAAGRIEEALSPLLEVSSEKKQEYLDLAKDDYDLLSEDGKLLWGGYFIYNSAEAVRADAELLSVKYSVIDFTGGIQEAYSEHGACFDVQTGERLTAADLTDDLNALKAAVRTEILDEAGDNSRYFDVEAFADTVLDGDQWYLGEDGLTVFANVYQIGTFNEGQVEFELDYDELTGLIDERWFPDNGHAGTLSVSFENHGFEELDSLELDSGADTWYILSSADLENVTLSRVEMDEEGEYVRGEELGFYAELGAGECLSITAYFMDTPQLAISTSAGEYLIAQSGKDSSLLLIPVDL